MLEDSLYRLFQIDCSVLQRRDRPEQRAKALVQARHCLNQEEYDIRSVVHCNFQGGKEPQSQVHTRSCQMDCQQEVLDHLHSHCGSHQLVRELEETEIVACNEVGLDQVDIVVESLSLEVGSDVHGIQLEVGNLVDVSRNLPEVDREVETWDVVLGDNHRMDTFP